MSLVPNKALEGASGNQGYKLQRSLRFRSSASAYLSRTPGSTGDRQKATISIWFKRGSLGSPQELYAADQSGSAQFLAYLDTNDTLNVNEYNGAYTIRLITNQVFRDPSAWYHLIISIDTTQATAANRAKLFLNGSQITSFSTETYPSQNTNTLLNYATIPNRIGNSVTVNRYLDGYLAEVNYIDGQALTPSSFGQTDPVTGVWTPKKYTGTYGTNGFYLPFSDNTSATTLAYDKSGNGNNWTPNNISTTAGATYDSMTDVPTLTSATAANFATLNPIGGFLTGGVSLSNANLNYSLNRTTYNCWTAATFQMPTTGKWYFETQPLTSSGTAPSTIVGLINAASANNLAASSANQRGICTNDGLKISDATTSAYGSAYALNDIINVAVDMDNGKIWFGKNGTWFSSGDPAAGTNAAFTDLNSSGFSWMPSILFWKVNTTETGAINFGQRPFSYTPPTGFKALNTFNLPDPTIKKPNQYMDATTYTGNGSSVTVSGKFQPDLMWFKRRSGTAQSHRLFDSARGNSTILISDSANGDNAGWVGDYTPTSDGFTVATGSGLGLVANTETFVGWQWKKGATPGFDIVTYTGDGTNRNISHNLGVAPKMIIVKSRSIASPNYGWQVQHTSLGATKSIVLNSTSAALTSTGFWNDTAPTSSVFTVGNDWDVNKSAATYVAYLFAEIAGFSKFGSYTGNGSADGPFVYCGFRPRWILMKYTNTTSYWLIMDTARNTYNVVNQGLRPNTSDADSTAIFAIDILSNGFKPRDAGGLNGSGNTIIYAAFAENPFKYSNAR